MTKLKPNDFIKTYENPYGSRWRWKDCPLKTTKKGYACYLETMGITPICKWFKYNDDNCFCRYKNQGDKIMKHILTIKPALQPKDRHGIEDALKKLGYKVLGGGTCIDRSSCDISFEKE